MECDMLQERDFRKEALETFLRALEREWDSLVEEAKESLSDVEDEENYIVFRLALLLFALKHVPPPHHYAYRVFKRESKYVFS